MVPASSEILNDRTERVNDFPVGGASRDDCPQLTNSGCIDESSREARVAVASFRVEGNALRIVRARHFLRIKRTWP
jgi:hypothetical protein